jgi:trimethylamine:corrinoid methyltransferase-like protein
MRDRARQQVKKILKEHDPQYVSEDVKKEIDRVAQAAQKRVLQRK